MCAQKGDIPTPRSRAASSLYGNQFYLFGGKNSSLEKLNDLYKLDLGMAYIEEIASTALFLASSDSSFINGVELCVDGGAAQC